MTAAAEEAKVTEKELGKDGFAYGFNAYFPSHEWVEHGWLRHEAPWNLVHHDRKVMKLISCTGPEEGFNYEGFSYLNHNKWSPIFATGSFETALPDCVERRPKSFPPINRLVGTVVNSPAFTEEVLNSVFGCYTCRVKTDVSDPEANYQFEASSGVIPLSGPCVLFLSCAIYDQYEACYKLVSMATGERIVRDLCSNNAANAGLVLGSFHSFYFSRAVKRFDPTTRGSSYNVSLRIHYLVQGSLGIFLQVARRYSMTHNEWIPVTIKLLHLAKGSDHYVAADPQMTNNLNGHMYGAVVGVVQVHLLRCAAALLKDKDKAQFWATYLMSALNAVAPWTGDVSIGSLIQPWLDRWIKHKYAKRTEPFIEAVKLLHSIVKNDLELLRGTFHDDPHVDVEPFIRHAVNAIQSAIRTVMAEDPRIEPAGNAAVWSKMTDRPLELYQVSSKEIESQTTYLPLYTFMWDMAFNHEPDHDVPSFKCPPEFLSNGKELISFNEVYSIIRSDIERRNRPIVAFADSNAARRGFAAKIAPKGKQGRAARAVAPVLTAPAEAVAKDIQPPGTGLPPVSTRPDLLLNTLDDVMVTRNRKGVSENPDLFPLRLGHRFKLISTTGDHSLVYRARANETRTSDRKDAYGVSLPGAPGAADEKYVPTDAIVVIKSVTANDEDSLSVMTPTNADQDEEVDMASLSIGVDEDTHGPREASAASQTVNARQAGGKNRGQRGRGKAGKPGNQ